MSGIAKEKSSLRALADLFGVAFTVAAVLFLSMAFVHAQKVDKPKDDKPKEDAVKKKVRLGITLDEMAVDSVLEGSTADGMGLKVGDVIQAWADGKADDETIWKPVSAIADLLAILNNATVGEIASIKVKRGDKIVIVSGELKEQVKEPAAEAGDWTCSEWFQADEKDPPKLKDYEGQTLVLFFFQHW
ncbi:MAG: PDZ domain-containing protein [Planctomycetota bacterium]